MDGPNGSSGRCSSGWPSFWLSVVFVAASGVLNGLILPALSTAFFNGGTDPCIGEAHDSPACKAALSRGSRIGSNFTLLGSICVIIASPFIALCCDRLGRKPMMVLGQIANLVAVLSLLAVDVLGISLYIYFCLSIVVASFCGQAGV